MLASLLLVLFLHIIEYEVTLGDAHRIMLILDTPNLDSEIP